MFAFDYDASELLDFDFDLASLGFDFGPDFDGDFDAGLDRPDAELDFWLDAEFDFDDLAGVAVAVQRSINGPLLRTAALHIRSSGNLGAHL